MLEEKNVILGVTGGIAAYKAVELLRLLTGEGARVKVIMTESACRFVAPLTFQTLSYNPVYIDMFKLLERSEIAHISLAEWCHLLVIAPATANTIAKLAAGMADNLLTSVALSVRMPRLVCPAMNVDMLSSAATQENIERLERRGWIVVQPEEGELACGHEGAGRLAEPEHIVEEIKRALTDKDLQGLRVLITAGPTRELIDPVRFISNRSSGKMGYAIARVARRRGADVVLISGPSCLPHPYGVRVINVESAREMRDAVLKEARNAEVVVKAAAVSDFAPKSVSGQKIKKDEGAPEILQLMKTPDILAELGRKKRKKQILAGFAAETEDLLENARKKLEDKNLDLIVANDVSAPGAGFGSDTNMVKILKKNGEIIDLPRMSKEEVAYRLLDEISGMIRES